MPESPTYKGKIKSIKKYDSQADNKTYLDVEIGIIDAEGKEFETRRLSFPLNTPEKEIEAEVKKVVSTYGHDKKLAAESAKVEAAHREADNAIKNLTGKIV